MPTKYNPDTGVPYFIPDFGEEIEEGVTPKPTVLSSKADVFKGDKKPTKREYEKLRDGPKVEPVDPAPYIHPDDKGKLWSSEQVYRMIEAVTTKAGQLVTPDQYERLKAEIESIGGELNAEPAKLDKDCATDEEIDAVERMAEGREVPYWPMLLRLLNRLRKAEGT